MIQDTSPPAVLLDTCVVIWLANGEPLPPAAKSAIVHAGLTDGMFVSTTSAWEIGLLSRPRPGRPPAVQCLPDPKTWFARFLTGPGIKEAPITTPIAIDASHLPGTFHSDPMDRLIVATARHLGMPIVTSDRKIIAYAESGYVRAIPC
ncbi:type II toxin-antitoxin system VapC family toxin [Acidisphaera sp. S103]|uniref:type II toxin-antitoxin system VapC family toxin n=1 Tax=Acidisphaera sp. S103 TaxID=1747223 RepID=UPI001C206B16|nr:type II toxin-antitoxin system VapC family toxin [Acidisphaera sp. S103]